MPRARILVIDDDTAALDLMRFYLQKHGFEVLTAETGDEGLQLTTDQQFDVMLTSLRLPDMDGVELVKRCQRASPETEIILTTTYCSVSVAIEAIQAGAFFFMETPTSEDHTLHLINQAISSRAQKAGIMQSSAGWKDRFAHYISNGTNLKHSNKPRRGILVVHGERNFLDSLQISLLELGFDIVTARNGEKGLKLSVNYQFDVAIISMFLPDMDGFKLVKDFESRSPQTRIIILTQKVPISEIIKALWAGPLPLSRSALTH